MNNTRFFAVTAAALFFVSCAPIKPLLTEEMMSDVGGLREECRTSRVNFNEAVKADSLFELAAKFKAKGRQREAYHYFDYAMILYRLALVKKELMVTSERTKELEATLNAANNRLESAEKTLTELKSARQP